MPSAHAKLSPSAAKRWLTCPGSVALSAQVVDSGSRAADEGTAGHRLFELAVTEGQNPYSMVGQTIDCKGTPIEVTEEMAGWVKDAAEWVVAYANAYPEAIILSEHEIDIGPVFGLPVTDDGKTNLWGTSDLVIIAADELVIFDLKLGYQDVPAEGNDQLQMYALGALHAFQLFAHDTVRLVIHQPRTGGAKECVVSADCLMEHALDYYRQRVLAACGPDAPRVPGDDQCQWCKGAALCPELKEQALARARTEFTAIDTLTVDELAEVLQKADLIRTALKHYEAHARKLLSLGVDVPGFKLVKGRKNRVWSNEGAAVDLLKTLGYDEDDFYPRALVTPAQAEKLIGKGGKDALAGFIATPEGEPTLATLDDSRPALMPDFEPLP